VLSRCGIGNIIGTRNNEHQAFTVTLAPHGKRMPVGVIIFGHSGSRMRNSSTCFDRVVMGTTGAIYNGVKLEIDSSWGRKRDVGIGSRYEDIAQIVFHK